MEYLKSSCGYAIIPSLCTILSATFPTPLSPRWPCAPLTSSDLTRGGACSGSLGLVHYVLTYRQIVVGFLRVNVNFLFHVVDLHPVRTSVVYTYRGLFKNLTLGQYLIPGELQEREEGPYRNHKVVTTLEKARTGNNHIATVTSLLQVVTTL